MRRGEIWTVSGGGDYTGKPRPVVIVQSDRIPEIGSITVCGLTSEDAGAPLFRVAIKPSSLNGLVVESEIMVDKISTVRQSRLGRLIGRLNNNEIEALNRSLAQFLDLSPPRTVE